MERLCLFIINNIDYNNRLVSNFRLNNNEPDLNLDKMRDKMFEILDRTKLSNLVMYPSNRGFNENVAISFKYNGRKCEIREIVEFDYEELELTIVGM